MNFLSRQIEKLEASRRVFTIVFFVGIVELFVHLWTLIHNVPFLARSTPGDAMLFAFIAASAGEVFSIGTLLLAFFVAGNQRIAALLSHFTMFALLLFNTAVADAISRGASIPLWMQYYADFLAPVAIFAIAGIGCVLLAHFDPLAQLRDAQLHIDSVRTETEAAMTHAIAAAIKQTATESSEASSVLSDAASQLVRNAASSVAGRLGGQFRRPATVAATSNTGSVTHHAPVQPIAIGRNDGRESE